MWSYGLYCPLCNDICREISAVCGPDPIWKTFRTTKLDNILKLETELSYKKEKCETAFYIDCLSNKFEFYVSSDCESLNFLEKVKKSDLSFHLEGDCRKCLGSWVTSNDISLSFTNKTIENFDLDHEEIWFDQKYIIHYDYPKSSMTIDKIIARPKFSGDMVETSKGNPLKLPLVEFDFKDKKKTLNKIKTMLVFS